MNPLFIITMFKIKHVPGNIMIYFGRLSGQKAGMSY